ncbi:MAG: GNAT family N-acetyltransferase [Bacteroidota bacterium]|nr:GNAT family N-acetyltransferase [Bacteroidota bacterium]
MNITFEHCDFENPVHLTALAGLLNHYMADPMGDAPPLNKLKQLRLVDGLATHPSAFVLFVLYKGEIAGLTTCFINFSTFNIKPYLYIHDLVVYAGFRNKGLGKALMEKLIELSAERGYCKITLEVREDNKIAQGLYRSLGFEDCNPAMFFWTKKL